MSDAAEATNVVINMQFEEFIPRYPDTGEDRRATGDKLA